MNELLSADRRFYSMADLSGLGLSHYRINKLVVEGRLVKLNNRMYENTSYTGDISDFATVAAYAPRGVFCMMTAARFYGFTTFLPDAVDVAIERDMKISTLPDWPHVTVWYFPEKRYETGVAGASDGTASFSVYDREKTVVDILYYRNKVGIEETKEVLRNYLAWQGRNLAKLERYAKELGCGKLLETYMEVLL